MNGFKGSPIRTSFRPGKIFATKGGPIDTTFKSGKRTATTKAGPLFPQQKHLTNCRRSNSKPIVEFT